MVFSLHQLNNKNKYYLTSFLRIYNIRLSVILRKNVTIATVRVLFVEGLLKCRRDVEDLAGFHVFGAVDYYVPSIDGVSSQVSHIGAVSFLIIYTVLSTVNRANFASNLVRFINYNVHRIFFLCIGEVVLRNAFTGIKTIGDNGRAGRGANENACAADSRNAVIRCTVIVSTRILVSLSLDGVLFGRNRFTKRFAIVVR